MTFADINENLEKSISDIDKKFNSLLDKNVDKLNEDVEYKLSKILLSIEQITRDVEQLKVELKILKEGGNI